MAYTGYLIYRKLKKVSDDGNETPLDVNNMPTSVSGLPQDTKDNVFGQPDYVPPVISQACQNGNDELEQSFQKQGCPSGQVGSFVPYVIPENTYVAPTKQEANQMALDDIAANGQNYANANGVCNPLPETFLRIQKNWCDPVSEPSWHYDLYSSANTGSDRVLLKSFDTPQSYDWYTINFIDTDPIGTHYNIVCTRTPGTNPGTDVIQVFSYDLQTILDEKLVENNGTPLNQVELLFPKQQPFRIGEDGLC